MRANQGTTRVMLMRVNQRPKSVESGKKAREIFLEEIDMGES